MDAVERAQWLAERRTGIGGSDAAAILGLSPWRTPLQVYLEKRGEGGEVRESEPMTWGRYLEPAIRQRYADLTGRSVEVPTGILRHPERPWQIATVDGLVGADRVLEVKTARSGEGWGEPGTDEIPEYYLPQVAHYLAVTGREVADVVVLIAGSEYRAYEVEADKDLQGLLTEMEAAFWERVVRGDPPEPTTVADALALFGARSEPLTVVASAELEAVVAELRDLKAELKALGLEEEKRKARVMAAMHFAELLAAPDGRALVTWKESKPPRRFDTSRFQADHPNLYDKYVTEGAPSRRFLLK